MATFPSLGYVTICLLKRFYFWLPGAGALGEQLNQEVAAYRSVAFTDNTKRTYQTHLRSYLAFCEEMQIKPVPVTDVTVAKYAAYLARRLKPSSVKQYINIIRLLHLECGLDNPSADSWYLKTTLKGIEKMKGTEVTRKVPVTPELLLQMRVKLNFTKTKDCVFWAACMVMFFGLLRKSNLFGTDSVGFNPDKQLTRDCFRASADQTAMIVTAKWSKTNQTRDHVLNIRLPELSGHPLCPVSAVLTMFRALGPAAPTTQAFPLTGPAFNRRLRALTSDLAVSGISSHSMRRGGATWALSSGIPGEVVKAWGDWKSVCYLVYLDQLPQTVMDLYRHQFARSLPQS